MSEALKLIQRAPIERDQDGWWPHPDGPEFEEDVAAFKTWLVQQGLELQQWHMDSDIGKPTLRRWGLPLSRWEITQPFRAALSRRELGTVGAGLPRDAMLAVLSLSRGKPAPTLSM